jgi:hypothetical protein
MNCLGEVLLFEELEETKTNLEILRQEFAGSEQKPQSSGDIGPDALIQFLIVRGLCRRICRKELFCPYPKCKVGIKSISALLKYLDKKHELADVYYKDLMRYFIHGL